eukprot:970728-Prorocentrum_minimum.AAC.7
MAAEIARHRSRSKGVTPQPPPLSATFDASDDAHLLLLYPSLNSTTLVIWSQTFCPPSWEGCASTVKVVTHESTRLCHALLAMVAETVVWLESGGDCEPSTSFWVLTAGSVFNLGVALSPPPASAPDISFLRLLPLVLRSKSLALHVMRSFSNSLTSCALLQYAHHRSSLSSSYFLKDFARRCAAHTFSLTRFGAPTFSPHPRT